MNTYRSSKVCFFAVIFIILWQMPKAYADAYTLERAIAAAIENDPWLEGSVLRQENLNNLSASVSHMVNPVMSVGLANVPSDSFDMSQEPMTQYVLGVSQRFRRGNSAALERKRFDSLSDVQPLARKDRQAKVALMVTHLWLDIFKSEQSIRIIESDRGLFEHLVDVALSNYTSTSRPSRQQDLIRAQLEITRLDDRLVRLNQMLDAQLAELAVWLNDAQASIAYPRNELSSKRTFDMRFFPSQHEPQKFAGVDPDASVARLTEHPLTQSLDKQIEASKYEVELARQTKKPQWGINASYGFRNDAANGDVRSDLFSASVVFDLPFVLGKKKTSEIRASQAALEEVKTQKALILRELHAGYKKAMAIQESLLQRQSLFRLRLLNEMAQQSEATLNAYESDDGDFAEVVRARIDELNASIDALGVEVDIQKNNAQIEYFLNAHEKESQSLQDFEGK